MKSTKRTTKKPAAKTITAAPTRTAIKVLRAGQSWHGGTTSQAPITEAS